MSEPIANMVYVPCIKIRRGSELALFYIHKHLPDSEAFTLTITSGFGCWSYYWGDPGEDAVKFLEECDRDYLLKKLSGGKQEFDELIFEQRALDEIKRAECEEDITPSMANMLIANIREVCGEFSGDEILTELNNNGDLIKEVFEYQYLSWGYDYPAGIKNFYNLFWSDFIDALKGKRDE